MQLGTHGLGTQLRVAGRATLGTAAPSCSRLTQMKPVAARARFWLSESLSAGRCRSLRPAMTSAHLAIGAQKKIVLRSGRHGGAESTSEFVRHVGKVIGVGTGECEFGVSTTFSSPTSSTSTVAMHTAHPSLLRAPTSLQGARGRPMFSRAAFESRSCELCPFQLCYSLRTGGVVHELLPLAGSLGGGVGRGGSGCWARHIRCCSSMLKLRSATKPG